MRLAALALLPLAACVAPAGPGPAPAAPPVEGVAYDVVSVGGSPVPDGVQPGFTIRGGRLEGNDGCNGMSGPARTGTGGRLSIGPLEGTLMACPPATMARAARITRALTAAERLVPLPDGTVALFAGGRAALILRAQAA